MNANMTDVFFEFRKCISYEIDISTGDKHIGHCKFVNGAISAYGLMSLLVVYFLIFLGFAFKLRNAMKEQFAQYDEFRLF